MSATTRATTDDLERAARLVAAAASYLDPKAIEEVIDGEYADEAARKLVEGLIPLFEGLAKQIRELAPADARDALIRGIVLDEVEAAAYHIIKNPAKKPRKLGPELRKGIWFSQLQEIVARLKGHGKSVEAHESLVFDAGFARARSRIAEKIARLPRFKTLADGSKESWAPTEIATIITGIKNEEP